jgi:ABC-type multidrug transport system fused ATPase/permease subunit
LHTNIERRRYVGSEGSDGASGRPILRCGAAAWPPKDGALELQHVDMRYRPGLPLVLEDVSFKVASGEKLGVVGRTGSGKSSLIQVRRRHFGAILDTLDLTMPSSISTLLVHIWYKSQNTQ